MTVIKSRHVQLTTSELEFNYLLIISLLTFPLWQQPKQPIPKMQKKEILLNILRKKTFHLAIFSKEKVWVP